MSDTSWDSYLPASSEQLGELADELGMLSDSLGATAEVIGPDAAPLDEAATDVSDAAWSTDAAADWSAWSEHSVEVADDYREQAAHYLESAASEAEQGWTSSSDYDLTQAGIALDMAGEYDTQSVSEASMSDGYLTDAVGSMDAAAAAVDTYDAGSYDAGSYDAGSSESVE